MKLEIISQDDETIAHSFYGFSSYEEFTEELINIIQLLTGNRRYYYVLSEN